MSPSINSHYTGPRIFNDAFMNLDVGACMTTIKVDNNESLLCRLFFYFSFSLFVSFKILYMRELQW